MTHPIFTATTPSQVAAILKETRRHPMPEAERLGWIDLSEEVEDMMHHAPRQVEGMSLEEHLADVAEFNEYFMAEVRRIASRFLTVEEVFEDFNANVVCGVSEIHPSYITLDLSHVTGASPMLRAYFDAQGAEMLAAHLMQYAAQIRAAH